jgi:hypothetical protein
MATWQMYMIEFLLTSFFSKNFFWKGGGVEPPHVPYGLPGLLFRLWPKCNRLLSDKVDVLYEYEAQGGALNLYSTKLPRPWSPWESSSSKKNPHGRTENLTRDLMISSQKLWSLDHEAGLLLVVRVCIPDVSVSSLAQEAFHSDCTIQNSVTQEPDSL